MASEAMKESADDAFGTKQVATENGDAEGCRGVTTAEITEVDDMLALFLGDTGSDDACASTSAPNSNVFDYPKQSSKVAKDDVHMSVAQQISSERWDGKYNSKKIRRMSLRDLAHL